MFPFTAATEASRNRQITGGDDSIITLGVVFTGKQVSRDLLSQKLLIGKVPIECANHPVAVTMSLWNGIIRRIATRVRITDDIEPVSAPSLAELARREQPLGAQADPHTGLPMRETMIETALFEGGAPVLLIPYITAKPLTFERVAIDVPDLASSRAPGTVESSASPGAETSTQVLGSDLI